METNKMALGDITRVLLGSPSIENDGFWCAEVNHGRRRVCK